MSDAGGRPSVLFVDDLANSVVLFRMHLAPQFDVEGFSSSRQAMQRASEREFDLLVADYRMLEVNGLELAAHFQANHPRTRRVLYTAIGHAPEVEAAKQSGLVELVLGKPIDLDEVARLLNALLAR